MEEIRRKFIIQDNFFLCSSSKVSELGLNSVSLWVGGWGWGGSEVKSGSSECLRLCYSFDMRTTVTQGMHQHTQDVGPSISDHRIAFHTQKAIKAQRQQR